MKRKKYHIGMIVAVSSAGAGGSHIFSHKGGLLQESAFEPPAPNAPWPRRAWQAPPAPLTGDFFIGFICPVYDRAYLQKTIHIIVNSGPLKVKELFKSR